MINPSSSLFNSTNFDLAAYYTMIIAAATLLLAFIAWTQLRKTNQISAADFSHRFKNDFFNENTQHLFMLFEYDLMIFRREAVKNSDDEFPYFEIDQAKLDSNPIFSIFLTEIKNSYTAYEIDDLLLGHFEDLGLFCKKGLMDIGSIYEGFDYYIEAIHGNQQITNYICWQTEQENGRDIYDNFDYIFKKVKYYGKRKEARAKMKRFFRNIHFMLVKFARRHQ